MPKTILGEETYRKEGIVKLFRRYKAELALTNEEIGKKLGINGRTFAKYLKRPEEMPLRLFWKTVKTLKIPKEDIRPFVV